METKEKATLRVDEAARVLGISRWSLYKAVKRDDSSLPFIKIGGRILFPKAALDVYVANAGKLS